MSLLVFCGVLLVYLRALPPSLVAWRDTGEMCTAAWTLGVAHPTSYPLYVLVGRAMRQIPLGNFAYRLDLLSAVAGALAVAGLFAWSRRRRGLAAALAASAWLAFDPVFWTVCQVSEMYSLWVVCAVGLLILALELSEDTLERYWPALCFLFGLCLGNRLDLLLWAPGLLWLALAHRPSGRDEDGVWHVRAGARLRVRLTMVAEARRYHVALVDPMPAGLEAVNPELAVTEKLPADKKEPEDKMTSRYWWWWRPWYEHENMRDERVEAFTSLLWDGVYNYSYVARATTPGSFVVPPTRAEEMYSPETFGRSATDKLIVE